MSILDTIEEVRKESEGEIDPLIEMRETIREIICECLEVKATGNQGCGDGFADVEFDFGDGLLMNVSISLYTDEDETEH